LKFDARRACQARRLIISIDFGRRLGRDPRLGCDDWMKSSDSARRPLPTGDALLPIFYRRDTEMRTAAYPGRAAEGHVGTARFLSRYNPKETETFQEDDECRASGRYKLKYNV
jgi:hypothetical protein